MKVKQAKLAQALRGETSNLIDEKKYDLEFDKGMLHARLKGMNPKGVGPFIVFPANIAFMEVYEENTQPSGQGDDQALPPKKPGRPARQ